MTDNAEIEKWIGDELNRGYDSKTIKKQLKQNGYKPDLIDGLVDQVAKEKDANNHAGVQDPAPNTPDNTQANPPTQDGTQNKPKISGSNSPQNSPNENSPTQNPTNSPLSNSPPNPAQFQSMSFIEKAKMIVLDPKAFFNIMPDGGGYVNPFLFYVIIMIIQIIFSSIYTIVLGDIITGFVSMILGIMFGLGASIAIIFFFALVLHIPLKILGGKGSYESTFRVMAYSNVLGIVSWIPWVGFIAILYQWYITVIGCEKVHAMSKGKVILAILSIIILVVIIALILFVVLGAAILSMFTVLGNSTVPINPVVG